MPVPAADVAALAARVRRSPPRAGRTRVVAVDGPSGSGKSTLADALAGALGGAAGPVPVVRMDDLYPGWDGLADAVPLLVEGVLEPLSRGEPGCYRRFDWAAGRYAEAHDVPAGDVLVVEGVGSGARACAPYLSLLVWVEAPRAVRFARGMARDGDAFRPHWQQWAEQETAHFAAEGTRDRADVHLPT
ncbi:hypothetical protein HJG43_06415 [Kineosporiaceae bacterium SCSIO 59966]|nr:hypothetical protein HJG43_06415 [Kineosporiaceae bacterium SCSIO 59966]